MSKTLIITESSIRKTVDKILKEEAGHLYWKDENGVAHTNSKETWRGVPGTTFISHGSWSDPEVWFDGVEFNAMSLEDEFWVIFQDYVRNSADELRENGIEPVEDEESYEKWLEYMGTDWIKSELYDLAWAMREAE